jgi:ribose 5-phosphate isomerase A
LFLSDNGNCIVDVEVSPNDDLSQLERDIKAIPGVVDTGLFLGMADVILVGAGEDFELVEERRARKENKAKN